MKLCHVFKTIWDKSHSMQLPNCFQGFGLSLDIRNNESTLLQYTMQGISCQILKRQQFSVIYYIVWLEPCQWKSIVSLSSITVCIPQMDLACYLEWTLVHHWRKQSSLPAKTFSHHSIGVAGQQPSAPPMKSLIFSSQQSRSLKCFSTSRADTCLTDVLDLILASFTNIKNKIMFADWCFTPTLLPMHTRTTAFFSFSSVGGLVLKIKAEGCVQARTLHLNNPTML